MWRGSKFTAHGSPIWAHLLIAIGIKLERPSETSIFCCGMWKGPKLWNHAWGWFWLLRKHRKHNGSVICRILQITPFQQFAFKVHHISGMKSMKYSRNSSGTCGNPHAWHDPLVCLYVFSTLKGLFPITWQLPGVPTVPGRKL